MEKSRIMYFGLLMMLNFVLTLSCQSQKPNVEEKQTGYLIDEYLIDPLNKTVSVRRNFSKGNVGTMMGYFPDRSIDFATTSLIVLGNELLFKEYFPREINFNTLAFVDIADGKVIYKDDRWVYSYPAGSHPNMARPTDKIDISAYKCLSNFIYEDKNGELLFLSTLMGTITLEKITDLPQLDGATLKHLQGQYFADKNGLYAFGVQYVGPQGNYKNNFSDTKKCILIERAKGKNVKPKVTRNYLIYNQSVYARNVSIEKLNLNIDKMIEHTVNEYSRIYELTDGINLYKSDNSTYELAEQRQIDYGSKVQISTTNILKIYPQIMKFAQNSDGKNLYFKNPVRDAPNFTDKFGMLIKTDKGFYFVDGGQPQPQAHAQKIENIFIYNYAKKMNEVFDDTEFLQLSDRMYAYKSLVFYDEIPLKELNGKQHFQFVKDNGLNAHFITSGDALIFAGQLGGYSTEVIDGAQKIIFEPLIARAIDVAKLKVINQNLLVDKDNFYDVSNGELKVIPIKKLGLPVKILLPDQYN